MIIGILDTMSTLGTTSVVFDLDGTLVDSEPNYYEAGRHLLAEQGVTDFTWADHEQYVGISTQESLELWKERYGVEAPLDDLLADMNRRYLALARASTPVYPEMRKFVELLAGEGVPMAVASGSSPEAIEAILTGTGLASWLTTVVSADEVARGKPAPTSSWRRRAGSGCPRRTVWSWRTPPLGPRPRTPPECAASRSPTSPPRPTTRRSRPRGYWCAAARPSSPRGRRTSGWRARHRLPEVRPVGR
uniref:Hydrolase n=1 Tax=Streptomyces avermitilis TaxID=33903 RepID=A0A499V9Z3_STRAX|nr:hypothetical protein SAVMC3_18370 [Streptomyces avermitilis]